MNKRLLAVSWYMPPMLYPRSIQVARLLAGLSQRGWGTTVICGEPGEQVDPLYDRDLERLYGDRYSSIMVKSDPPSLPYTVKRELLLKPSDIIHVAGNCYMATLQTTRKQPFWILSDSDQFPQASETKVFEGEIPLGPPHSPHSQIQSVGQGSFSNWYFFLYFSTSDNSDPRLNGRKYRISYRAVPPLFLERARKAQDNSHKMLWLKPAIQAALNAIKQKKYAALITFGQPWVDHLVGLELHKRTRLPWIAHFSDPWVDSVYNADLRHDILKTWSRKEEEVIRQASTVIFTNAQAWDLVMGKYPLKWQAKATVIPHSYDLEVAPIAAKKSKTKRLRMVYFGNVFPGRTPNAFLKALSLLTQKMQLQDLLRVDFVGNGEAYQKQADELGLAGIVTFHGSAPYLTGLKIAAEADVFLLMDAPSLVPSPFLPSKVVDYMMFKKVIFGLTPETGATADLMRRLGCPFVPPDDISAIVDGLAQLLTAWQSSGLQISPAYETVAEEFDVSQVALQFDRALKGVIEPYSEKNSTVVLGKRDKPRKVCFVAPSTYPLFDSNYDGPFGGWEVRISLIARELARYPDLQVFLLVADHGQPHLQVIDNVHLVSWTKRDLWGISFVRSRNPLADLRNRIRYLVKYRLRRLFFLFLNRLSFLFTFNPFSVYSYPYKVLSGIQKASLRVWRYFRPQKIWGEIDNYVVTDGMVAIYEEIDADVYIVPGNTNFSAETAAYCAVKGRKYVFLAGSDFDYYPEYKENPRGKDIYGTPHSLKVYSIEHADAHIVQNERQARLLSKTFGRPSTLIKNPIDVVQKFPRKKRTRKILWVGKSDERVKRPLAFMELAKRTPELQYLMILNKANRQTHLQCLIEAAKLPNLTVIEKVPFEEVEKYFADAMIHINTSIFEGFPNTFLQAAKYGVPTLSLKVDPGNMLSKYGCGQVCNDDLASLAAVLRDLVKNKSKYKVMSKNNLAYVRKYHDKHKIILKFRKLLLSIG